MNLSLKASGGIVFNLELKIPPLLLMFLFGLLMWLLSILIPDGDFLFHFRKLIILIFFLIATIFSISGVVSFRLANTTVNPMKPNETSSLVTKGIYKVTRNPMYVGFLFYLISWGFFLTNIYALLLPLIFIFYMNKFQIKPEESSLLAIFGNEYTLYMQRVRRWL